MTNSSKSPLAKRREELGLTQEELGRLIELNDQTISNYELGIYRPRFTIGQFKVLCTVMQWQTIEELPDRLGPLV